MKALFIGGTGTISTAITELAPKCGIELYLLNRGNKKERVPQGVKIIEADINNEADVREKIKDLTFDTVADFIVFDTDAIESRKNKAVHFYQHRFRLSEAALQPFHYRKHPALQPLLELLP